MVLIGKPGTWSGLVLRIGQCAFAASSIGVMVSALGFSSFTAFCYLIASMGLQVLWSFGIACLDVYALRRKRSLQNPILVSLFFVGDWVTATLSLAAACSSAGIIVLYARDLGVCKFQAQLPCGKFHTSIALAFVTWALIAGFRHFTIYSISAIYMATRRDVKWQSGDRRSEATASETGEEVQKP